ncbi:MAG: cupin domain-containing protein [Rhodospirillum sp.]|nr:cupin domain-containing protein [Rhodospirillum sp.]MCF8488512.1 cupin domain-containing protein [Rhodospirillum sp.]MCF8499257.1 cupin domain-containing protein [Rhodospirillum sp.]
MSSFIVKGLPGLALTAATMVLSACAATEAPTPGTEPASPSSVMLLETSTHGDGVPLVYPAGTPLITSRITTFPPHSKTSVHRHLVPLYAYILEGELTIHPEGGPPRIFKKGDAFMETAGWHYGENKTDKPIKLLAVYAGEVGVPLAVRKDAPAPAPVESK